MPSQEIELADGVDEYQYFLEKDWCDGFPVVAPTESRLRWILRDEYYSKPAPAELINELANEVDVAAAAVGG